MKAMRLTMYKSTRVTGMALALATLLNTTAPVWATVDNTVTVSGTAPDSSTVTATGSATVDVQNAAPQISLNKTHAFAPGGDLNNNGLVDPGDVILFTYTATNTGNVTLANVVASDTAFQGTGTAPTISPASVASLAPGGTTSFTSTYTVVAGDLVISGNVDSDLDSTGQVVGNYNPGTGNTTVTATDPEAVPLNVVPSLTVAKTGTPSTNVPAGTVVTYTYTVTNSGTVPITNVTLSDNVTAGSGPNPVPVFASWTTQNGSTVSGNTITLLNPGAVAVFTGTYTITQSDVDTLQ
jgi:uncharacterized repeat protein (TIGR01451 family)